MIKVREFKEEDVDTLLKIQEEHKKDLGDLFTKESLLEESKYIKFFIAEENSSVVGYSAFTDLKNGIGMMHSVVVKKDAQRKGIGRELIKSIKNYSKENGYRKVLFLTKIDNLPMIILGLKEGFELEGVLKRHFPRTYEDVVYMSYFIEENY